MSSKKFFGKALALAVVFIIVIACASITAGASGFGAPTSVANFDSLKAALSNSSVSSINVTGSITYSGKTDPKLAVNRNITISGNGNASIIDLGGYSIALEGSGTLTVNNLTLKNTDRSGFFSAYTSNKNFAGKWDAVFSGVKFTGSSLIGQRTASPEYGMFSSAAFNGVNSLNSTDGVASYAVVYATEVLINGTFTMNGNNNSVYFKSVNSSGIGTGTDAYGTFNVAQNADVKLIRNVSSSSSNVNKDNLIEGYKNFIFGTNSVFNATAGTNCTESNKGYAQTAIIHSCAAENFIVNKGARVYLKTDSSLANYPATHGSTAISLRKPGGGHLEFLVDEEALLDIQAYGSSARSRDLAPVLILSKVAGGDSGDSNTTIKGKLNVYSKNGNGWYYQYIDYKTIGHDDFTVDGGEANIFADCVEGRATTGEYAAFEHYGPTDFDLQVYGGGYMQIKTNGWRAMSLAGGTIATPVKAITVSGKDADYNPSKLYIIGGQFAIAAEGKTMFQMNVLDGGYVYTENTQDSNIYTVGQADYIVNGLGSKLEMVRKGKPNSDTIKDSTSLYGVIFHDAPLVGPLTIDVTDGGVMDVKNNFGSRAAITTQSHYITNHLIHVSGEKSKLTILNTNTGKASGNDQSLYPVGAVAFAANCAGNIIVENNGSFFATSYSPDSPTIALGSYGTSNYTGTLTVDNTSLADIRNNAPSSRDNRTIALRGRNYSPGTAKDYAITLDVSRCYTTVWNVDLGPLYNDHYFTDAWMIATFTAYNSVASNTYLLSEMQNTFMFDLAKYGRIKFQGEDYNSSSRNL